MRLMEFGLDLGLHAFNFLEVEILLIKVEALEPSGLRLPIRQLTAGLPVRLLQRFDIFSERVGEQFVLRAGVEMFSGGLSADSEVRRGFCGVRVRAKGIATDAPLAGEHGVCGKRQHAGHLAAQRGRDDDNHGTSYRASGFRPRGV